MSTARAFAVFVVAWLSMALLAACGASSEEEEAEGSEDALTDIFDESKKLVPNGRDEPIAVPTKGTILTELVQPELLFRLEKQGYHFTNVLGQSGRLPNAQLHDASSTYRGIVTSIVEDVDALKAADATLTTKVIQSRTRVFDTGWLKSPYATFDLIGVVNRVDRRDVGTGHCGEARFVYRLSYVKSEQRVPTFSRMPFFFNVVYQLPAGDCAKAIEKWQVKDSGLSEDAYVTWLTGPGGPLDKSGMTLKQIEVNGQVVRVPSENKTDMGGHAEYLLRVFDAKNGSVELRPLENTPDVKRITGDAALRAELLAWIEANTKAIDEGTAVMPEKFSARKGTSFTTFGSLRRANKLFSQIFEPQDLARVSFEGTRLVASPEALLFRLDDMTCVGCHQGRSVAGFHLLGRERGSRTNPLNALRVHASPHYLAERDRRAAYFTSALAGRADRLRAMSFEPPPNADAEVGTHCILPDDTAKFRTTWKCASGTTCTAVGKNARAAIDLGECLPESGGFAGLPCLSGDMTENETNPRKDRLTNRTLGCKGAYACLKPEEGTPGGMCVAACRGKLGEMNGANEICAFGGGAQFDACAASGNFAACIESAVRPAPRQACDEEHPCREDYMCQRLEPIKGNPVISTTPKTKGFCNPTYFIFQMRLDGHPTP